MRVCLQGGSTRGPMGPKCCGSSVFIDHPPNRFQDSKISNRLILNTNKTETVIFSLRRHSTDAYSFSCARFLAVVLYNKLTCDKHTELACKGMSRNIFLLRNLVKCVSQATVLTAYRALILSLTYWYGAPRHKL